MEVLVEEVICLTKEEHRNSQKHNILNELNNFKDSLRTNIDNNKNVSSL